MKFLNNVFKKEEPRDNFAKLVIQLLRAQGITRTQYDSQQFLVKIFDDEGTLKTSIFLDNAFAEYSVAEVQTRDQVVHRYVTIAKTASVDVPKNLIEAIPKVLPRVAPRMLLEEMESTAHLQRLGLKDALPRLTNGNGSDGIPHVRLKPHHCISLLYDFPTHMVTLQQKTLDDWGTNFAELLDIGRKNLLKLSGEPFRKISDGLYVSPFGDNHDASRLLLTDKIRAECRLKGDPVAILPNRDTLLIADCDDPSALQAAIDIASQVLKDDPRPYSAFPLILKGSEWHEFELNEFHPAYSSFCKLALTTVAHMYNVQKQLLEAVHEKTGEDLFVATFVLLQDKQNDQIFSLSTWSENVDTLLPLTQELVLVQPSLPESQRTVRCSFARAMEILPALFEKTDLYPERLRVRRFPSPSEIRRLANS